ncbi:hypothetical protein P7K49_024663, partial [Saguinus oedipus]
TPEMETQPAWVPRSQTLSKAVSKEELGLEASSLQPASLFCRSSTAASGGFNSLA